MPDWYWLGGHPAWFPTQNNGDGWEHWSQTPAMENFPW